MVDLVVRWDSKESACFQKGWRRGEAENHTLQKCKFIFASFHVKNDFLLSSTMQASAMFHNMGPCTWIWNLIVWSVFKTSVPGWILNDPLFVIEHIKCSYNYAYWLVLLSVFVQWPYLYSHAHNCSLGEIHAVLSCSTALYCWWSWMSGTVFSSCHNNGRRE